MTAKKGKVVDMFTGKSMHTLGDTPNALDAQINLPGSTYIGVLPQQVADKLRTDGEYMHARKEQLEAMFQEWELAYTQHIERLATTLATYKMLPKPERLAGKQISIDANGHVFLVDVNRLN